MEEIEITLEIPDVNTGENENNQDSNQESQENETIDLNEGQEHDSDQNDENSEESDNDNDNDNADDSDDDSEEDDDSVPDEIVKAKYELLKEKGILDETDTPTEEYIDEQLETLPDRVFLNYVKGLPEFMQKAIIYGANQPGLKQEDFIKFVNDFVSDTTGSIDISTNEGARTYLKSLPAFKELYESDEEVDEVLNILEDKGTLVSRAEKLKAKDDEKRNAAQQKLIDDAEKAKEAKKKSQKEFADRISQESENLNWKDERKRSAISNINQEYISTRYQNVIGNPKGIIQLADIFSYIDENGTFDKLYEVLEGKVNSKKVNNTRKNIEKQDALTRALSKSKAPKNTESGFEVGIAGEI